MPAVEGLLPDASMPAPGTLPPGEPAPFSLMPYPTPSDGKPLPMPSATEAAPRGPALSPAEVGTDPPTTNGSPSTENDETTEANESKVPGPD
ncbi:MAG: hypothetical protein D6741_15730, partial [Planctomycetota bacterium]